MMPFLETGRGLGPIQRKFGPIGFIRKELLTLGLNEKLKEFPLKILIRGGIGGKKKCYPAD